MLDVDVADAVAIYLQHRLQLWYDLELAVTCAMGRGVRCRLRCGAVTVLGSLFLLDLRRLWLDKAAAFRWRFLRFLR